MLKIFNFVLEKLKANNKIYERNLNSLEFDNVYDLYERVFEELCYITYPEKIFLKKLLSRKGLGSDLERLSSLMDSVLNELFNPDNKEKYISEKIEEKRKEVEEGKIIYKEYKKLGRNLSFSEIKLTGQYGKIFVETKNIMWHKKNGLKMIAGVYHPQHILLMIEEERKKDILKLENEIEIESKKNLKIFEYLKKSYAELYSQEWEKIKENKKILVKKYLDLFSSFFLTSGIDLTKRNLYHIIYGNDYMLIKIFVFYLYESLKLIKLVKKMNCHFVSCSETEKFLNSFLKEFFKISLMEFKPFINKQFLTKMNSFSLNEVIFFKNYAKEVNLKVNSEFSELRELIFSINAL